MIPYRDFPQWKTEQKAIIRILYMIKESEITTESTIPQTWNCVHKQFEFNVCKVTIIMTV